MKMYERSLEIDRLTVAIDEAQARIDSEEHPLEGDMLSTAKEQLIALYVAYRKNHQELRDLGEELQKSAAPETTEEVPDAEETPAAPVVPKATPKAKE